CQKSLTLRTRMSSGFTTSMTHACCGRGGMAPPSELGPAALDDRGEVRLRGQRPHREARVAPEPRGAEGVGDGARRVPHDERALEREREPLDETPRARLERVEVAELALQVVDEEV